MNSLYRGSSKDASYQVSFQFAKLFQRRRIFLNQPIRNKNYLWRPCLLTDPDEMSNLYIGPAIDANFQVSLHLTEGFQRRRLKCEKLTDRRRTPSDDKSSHCRWQGELKKTNRRSPQLNIKKTHDIGLKIQVLYTNLLTQKIWTFWLSNLFLLPYQSDISL